MSHLNECSGSDPLRFIDYAAEEVSRVGGARGEIARPSACRNKLGGPVTTSSLVQVSPDARTGSTFANSARFPCAIGERFVLTTVIAPVTRPLATTVACVWSWPLAVVGTTSGQSPAKTRLNTTANVRGRRITLILSCKLAL